MTERERWLAFRSTMGFNAVPSFLQASFPSVPSTASKFTTQVLPKPQQYEQFKKIQRIPGLDKQQYPEHNQTLSLVEGETNNDDHILNRSVKKVIYRGSKGDNQDNINQQNHHHTSESLFSALTSSKEDNLPTFHNAMVTYRSLKEQQKQKVFEEWEMRVNSPGFCP